MHKLAAFLLGFSVSLAALAQQPPVLIVLTNPLTQATAPIIAPAGGTFTGTTPFTITSPLGGQVDYTVDSTAPALGNGILCTSPCTGSAAIGLKVRAIALVPGYLVSPEAIPAIFNIQQSPTGTPIFNPNGGLSQNPWSVALSDPTPLSSFYCSVNAATPSCSGPQTPGPFAFGTPGISTLQCVAQAPGFACSGVQSQSYNYAPPSNTPVITPAAGPYTSSVPNGVIITFDCPSPSGVVYYTLNNQTPTSASPVYTGPIPITSTTTVQALGLCPNYGFSGVAISLFTINQPVLSPPTFVPGPTTSASPIPWVMNGTAGSTGIYTTDLSQPSSTNGTQCAIPCSGTASSTETLIGMQVQSGYVSSPTASVKYTVSGPLSACPASSGTISTNAVTASRANGASPLLIFFDASATTDSSLGAGADPFTDDTYTWNFQDGGISGSGVWQNGSSANKSSTNSATGAIASHLFIYSLTPGSGAQTFRPKLTVSNGTSSLSCLGPVITVKDPAAAGGYPTTATTCVSSSSTPVAGANDCPAGTNVLKTSSFNTALNATFMGSGKRVLFLCADTFSGSNAALNGVNMDVGAYGFCENTQTNRPIFNVPLNTSAFVIGSAASDWRIHDIDIEGPASSLGNGANAAIQCNGNVCTQGTVYNVKSNGPGAGFYDFNGTQIGLIGFNAQPMGNINTFLNPSENQRVDGVKTYSSTATYRLVDYNTIQGSFFDGKGQPSGGANIEVVRISACRKCVISNNTIQNANLGGAVLKIHNGNPSSQTAWIGQYTEQLVLSDNLFTGNAGAQMVELAPQNSQTDERLRKVLFERNLMKPIGAKAGMAVLIDAMNARASDNVSYNNQSPNGSAFVVGRRGIEWGSVFQGYALESCPNNFSHPSQCSGNATADFGTPFVAYGSEPSGVELWNNSLIQTQSNTGANFQGRCTGASDPTCAGGGQNFYQGGGNYLQNFLMYSTGGGSVAADGQHPTGANTIGNNTTTVTSNPALTNGSSSFGLLSDFIPTTNYSGATAVPVFFDGLGVSWPSAGYDLGAISHTNFSPTTVFWTQPTNLGPSVGGCGTGAQCNFYATGGSPGFPNPSDSNLYMTTVEPIQCPGGTDNSKAFINTVDVSSVTGLQVFNNVLSYQNPASPCAAHSGFYSTVQAQGGAIGVYEDYRDLCTSGTCVPVGSIYKFGLFDELRWNPSPALTYPFVNYNGVDLYFDAQVPTATVTGAGGQAGNTSNTYASMDLQFIDSVSGVKIVYSVSFFFFGQAAQTKQERLVFDTGGGGALEVKGQVNPAALVNPYNAANPAYFSMASSAIGGGTPCTPILSTDSNCFQSTTWGGFPSQAWKRFHVTISEPQFTQVLTDAVSAAANLPRCTAPGQALCIPTNFSLNPNTYGLTDIHTNGEGHGNPANGPFTLGYSIKNTNLSFF